MMKISIKSFFYEHRFFICAYLFLMLHAFLVPGEGMFWREDAAMYAFHIVDFSMGFCSRILPGAIYRLLTGGIYTQTAVTVYETILISVFFIFLAVFFEKLIISSPVEDRPVMAFLLFLFAAGPFSFSLFIRQLGMLDVYWVYFSSVILFFISKKKLVWFAAPLFFALIMVHYGAILTYIPAILLLMLYLSYHSEDKKTGKRYFFVFLTSLAISVASCFYFVFFERSNLTYSMDEFMKILYSRHAGGGSEAYYDFIFYREFADKQFMHDYIASTGYDVFGGVDVGNSQGITSVLHLIWQQLSGLKILRVIYNFRSNIPSIVLLVPLLFLLFGFLIFMVKRQEKTFGKLLFVGSGLLFVVSVAGGMMMSTDINRWVTHAFLGMFVFVLCVLRHEKETALTYFKSVFSRIPKLLAFVYAGMYSLLYVNPYCG